MRLITGHDALFIGVWLQIWRLQQMTPNVLVQVAFLGESQITIQLALVGTDERALLCVDSQVVIKVVPLSEVHGATWEVALQDL